MSDVQFCINAGNFIGGHVPLEIIPTDSILDATTELFPVNEERTIQLHEGRYLLRVRLPNGRILSKTIRVPVKESQPIRLQAEDYSPNEDATWAYVFQRGSDRKAGSHLKAFYRAQMLASNPSRLTLNWVVWTCRTGTTFLDDVSDNWSSGLHALPDDVNAALILTPNDYPNSGVFLEIEDPEGNFSTFFSIPRGTQRILVTKETWKKSERSDSPWNVLAEFGSPDARALLSYLNSGSAIATKLLGQRVAETAVIALRGKFNDFSNAVVAAYYLVMNEPKMFRNGEAINGVPVEHLLEWMRNLDRFFKDSPDGAIINGFIALRREDTANAIDRFEEAFHRGIPMFSIGLKLLWEGIRRLCAVTGSDIARDLRKRVRPWAASADWDSLLTAVRTVPTKMTKSRFVPVDADKENPNETAAPQPITR